MKNVSFVVAHIYKKHSRGGSALYVKLYCLDYEDAPMFLKFGVKFGQLSLAV